MVEHTHFITKTNINKQVSPQYVHVADGRMPLHCKRDLCNVECFKDIRIVDRIVEWVSAEKYDL